MQLRNCGIALIAWGYACVTDAQGDKDDGAVSNHLGAFHVGFGLDRYGPGKVSHGYGPHLSFEPLARAMPSLSIGYQHALSEHQRIRTEVVLKGTPYAFRMAPGAIRDSTGAVVYSGVPVDADISAADRIGLVVSFEEQVARSARFECRFRVGVTLERFLRRAGQFRITYYAEQDNASIPIMELEVTYTRRTIPGALMGVAGVLDVGRRSSLSVELQGTYAGKELYTANYTVAMGQPQKYGGEVVQAANRLGATLTYTYAFR